MHLGSFDKEPETVVLMDAYIEQNGYVNDINGERCITRSICQMQEKLPRKSGKQLFGIPLKRCEKFFYFIRFIR